MAKEHMRRSLVQLFEDTVRDKLMDALSSRRTSGAFGSSAMGKSTSRRPFDRGLDRRDRSSDFVLPEAVREQLGRDVYLVVEHEMHRILTTVGDDVAAVFTQVMNVRNRIQRLEEDVLQHDVDAKMQAEQIVTFSNQAKELQAELVNVRDSSNAKEKQMDILREQLHRRNVTLDETRIQFRKEVMRYKQRVYELEMEKRVAPTSAPANVSGAGRHSQFATGGDSSTTNMSNTFPLNVSNNPYHKDYTLGASATEEEIEKELTATAEVAVKEVTARHEEEKRRMEVLHLREKKATVQECNLKISERDAEIARLKEKIRIYSEPAVDETVRN